LSDIAERAHSEWSRLEEQWLNTRREWRDEVAARFEREFWQPWKQDLPRLLRELDELEDTLDRALQSLS